MKSMVLTGLTTVLVAGMILSAGRVPAWSSNRLVRPDRGALAFRQAMNGAAVRRDAELQLAVGPRGMGLIVAAAICPDEAFLLDRQLSLVHRVDLGRGAIVGDLGGPSSGANLRAPRALAADCAARRVYVVDAAGVVVLDVDSGAARRRFSQPAGFTNSAGPAVFDADAQALYAPGLWPQARRLGYRLDLATGAASPLVPAVDRGCWSLGPNCIFATLDRLRTPAGGWIAAHRVSAAVGVFDQQLRPTRTIDVRSPMFLENGEQNGSPSLVDMVAWNEHNSVIRGVFSFGDTIATVHTFNRTHNWTPGQQTDFEVFMNLHSIDGEGLASDIRLPDLPVGRDDTSLYIVDYGSRGRRPLGLDPVTLIRVRVGADPAVKTE